MWIAFLLVFQDLVLCQELTDTEAARLERLLIKSPENLQLRMRSVAVRQKRWKSAMWMVVHHPDHEQVFRSAARFTRALVGQVEFEEAHRLWDAAIARNGRSSQVRWNAALFFSNLDERWHLQLLEETAELDPNHPEVLRPLAHLYGAALMKEGSITAENAA
ncbi:MAG: hypothetical protein FJW36_25955 [Acidobacteria bacterium]|nr:hypothetical protein [Acidobacteriota bacterium]